MGLLGAPGFHVILAAAANDIAAARGLKTSEAGLKHQRIAIALVNKKLSDWRPDSSNESLASVALLAGLEVSYIPTSCTFGSGCGFDVVLTALLASLRDPTEFQYAQ